MILDIIKKIDSLESFDSKTIMETFTFEERRLLATEAEPLTSNLGKIKEFVKKLIEEKVIIFTPEEMDRIVINNNDIYSQSLLFAQYDDERLLKMITDDTQLVSHPTFYADFLKKDESFYKLIELYAKGKLDSDFWSNMTKVASRIKNDELKIKCMQLLSKLPKNLRIDGYQKAFIVSSLSNDDAKITALHLVPNIYKSDVICSMESDDTKVRYINLFSRNKGDIIASLKDDELKEFYYKKYYKIIFSTTRAQIITSFDDIELTRKYLPTITGDDAIRDFIWQCKDEDLRYEASKKIHSDKDIMEVIEYFQKPENQLALIRRISNLNALFKDDDYAYLFIRLSTEATQELMPYITEKNKISVIRRNIYPKNLILLTQITDFNQALECLGHLDYLEGKSYKPEIDPAIEYIATNLNVDQEHLKTLVKQTSPEILKYVTNKNIMDCLNLSDKDFQKYMMLIKPEHQQMDMDSINDMLNVILNRRFKIERKEDDHIFSSFQSAIEHRDKNRLFELFEKLSTLVDINSKITNLDEFIEKLIARDIDTINELHDITQEYIRIAKDNYVKGHIKENREKVVKVTVDRGEYIKILLASDDADDIIQTIEYIKEEIPEKELQDLINNKELLKKLIEYKKNPKEYGAPPKEIKRELKNLNILLNYIYKFYAPSINGYDYLKAAVTQTEKAPETNMESVIYILSEINVKELRDTVFNNEELFQELLKFVNSYKVLGWNDNLKELANGSGLIIYDSIISALISNYEAIKRNLESKVAKGEIPKATIGHIIDLAACYDASSMVYKYIFGAERFTLLKNNPGPNKSSMNSEERIAKGLDLLEKIKGRDSITTPPIDKDYQLTNNKELHVRIGHVNSLDNLVYGERTGACMRIGGAGNSLFEFCLLNKHGFHVEITDPKTGDFVSRVSGFRNGNTIFLNQLRDSKSPGYTDSDLIELIKMVANNLIELSKKSDFPIDNVVISADYVMERSKEKTTDLGVENIKKGFDRFYTDVSGNAIILATSSQDSAFVPVVLSTKVPEYIPLRERMKTYKYEQASIKINEMIALDEYLSGKPLEDIELDLNLDINTSYIGNDWYISISNDGQITTYIMKSCKNKEKAEQEMKKVLEVIKEKSHKQIAMMSESNTSSKHM